MGRHAPTPVESPLDGVSSQVETDGRTVSHKKKRPPDNPSMQPSTADKFIGGVWDSIYSGIKLDPVDVVEQWQAIESNGQPRLLMETDYELANLSEEKRGVVEGMFGRMNVLTRRISQTSRACRSLEVIVQAYWVHCFDGHVEQLAASMPRDKAKKTAISQACIDFNWSEKELRNKMGGSGGAITTYGNTVAGRLWWRQLLGIIGGPTERKYTGHSHDWVVGSTFDEAIPLAPTYYQWDPEFSYTHLEESVVDEDVWGDFDPRDVDFHSGTEEKFKCATCGEQQSHDPKLNTCTCFPNLYGGTKARMMPVQVFRTPNGKNNGLIACAAFEEGAAIGEFIGQITAGLSGTDVMIGQTERATYQISQRRQGNHLRFVNHSCQPNSQYERFSWLGKQRIVLVSKGVEAGQEITVDYSDTYWRNLDKVCLCGQPGCRYKDRDRRLLAASEST
ncbi:SET domain-containing protein [Hortaea werneckii]|nr:SET domain-containing protein [Hortaea werneckii]KAI7648180.1 SET domain-containing protein [Hortaea werneckii]